MPTSVVASARTCFVVLPSPAGSFRAGTPIAAGLVVDALEVLTDASIDFPLMRRDRLSRRVESWLEGPMVFLAFVWIGLMVIEFVQGERAWVTATSNIIWGSFVIDFLLRFFLAENKAPYLRRNWLTLVSLLLPALRIFRLTRALRLARATRGLRLLRLATSLNRSVRALMKSMGRKGLGYVLVLTLIVTFSGAAGMFVFETGAFRSYWDALWWTAMIVATMGSDFWPNSPEGRALCLALAVYAFSIFGYVTAALASFLVEQNKPPQGDPHDELAQLRQELARLAKSLDERGGR